MLAIEVLVDEILRLQNLTMYLQGRLQEARKMQEENWFVAHPEVMRFILKHEQAQELINRMCASPLIVIMEDEIIHTDEHPFCDDPSCGCHQDIALLKEQVFEPFFNGLLTAPEAHRFMEGEQL